MKGNNSYFIVLLLGLSFVTSFNLYSAPRSTPVTVVNDVTAPVPVEGAVDASIVGTPGVTIENSPALPIPITGVGSPRVNDIIHLVASSTGTATCGSGDVGRRFFSQLINGLLITNPFTIPVNKRLIVTNISFIIESGSPSTSVEYTIGRQFSQFGGNAAFQTLVLTDSSGAGAGVVSLSPGVVSSVDLCFFPPSTGSSSVAIYGYLIDI